MRLLFSLAALLVMTVGSATAQPPETDASRRPRSNLILEIWTGDVERELGVSDDLARKLALLRSECQMAVQKEYENAGINPLDYPNKMTPEQRQTYIEIKRRVEDEYISKAAALLSPDQITRLRQIEFQQILSSGPWAFTGREVALELKLTNNQKRALTLLNREYREASSGGFNLNDESERVRSSKLRAEYLDKAIELLTDEQKETLSNLKGKEFTLGGIGGRR